VDSNDSVDLPPEPEAGPVQAAPWAPAPPTPSPPVPLSSGNAPELLWLIGHGRLTLGFLLLLTACVPFLGLAHLVFYPAAALYLGLNGYELAWREQPYHSVHQLEERERVWMFWGAALFIVFFVMLLVALVYLRFLAGQVDDFIEGL
jgi:hypothetical protein